MTIRGTLTSLLTLGHGVQGDCCLPRALRAVHLPPEHGREKRGNVTARKLARQKKKKLALLFPEW